MSTLHVGLTSAVLFVFSELLSSSISSINCQLFLFLFAFHRLEGRTMTSSRTSTNRHVFSTSVPTTSFNLSYSFPYFSLFFTLFTTSPFLTLFVQRIFSFSSISVFKMLLIFLDFLFSKSRSPFYILQYCLPNILPNIFNFKPIVLFIADVSFY